jgi:hypothetical protein
MRTMCGIAIAGMLFGIACGGKVVGPANPQGSADTAGAQAAARLTAQDYEKVEMNVGDGYGTLQKQLAAGQMKEASKTAQDLTVSLAESERFWAQNKKTDALKWVQDARTFALQVVAATTAGDRAKANQAAANMQGACKQCHATYREADPAGGYRVKPAAVLP